MNNETNRNYILILTKDPLDHPDYLYWALARPAFLFASSLPYEDFVSRLDATLTEMYSLLELQHPFRTIKVHDGSIYGLAMLDSFRASLQDLRSELDEI